MQEARTIEPIVELNIWHNVAVCLFGLITTLEGVRIISTLTGRLKPERAVDRCARIEEGTASCLAVRGCFDWCVTPPHSLFHSLSILVVSTHSTFPMPSLATHFFLFLLGSSSQWFLPYCGLTCCLFWEEPPEWGRSCYSRWGRGEQVKQMMLVEL